MNALTAHRLVSSGWRVVRPDEQTHWHASPVVHTCGENCPCAVFATFTEALQHVRTMVAIRGAER